jgi:hypothetical protein
LSGIGWGGRLKEWCSVTCRKCGARGPSCASNGDEATTIRAAYDAWNARDVVDASKMDRHLKLCRRNLKSDRVVCCGACPFERIIVGFDVSLAPLFEAKRKAKRGA